MIGIFAYQTCFSYDRIIDYSTFTLHFGSNLQTKINLVKGKRVGCWVLSNEMMAWVMLKLSPKFCNYYSVKVY
jgi:hypothetical protein